MTIRARSPLAVLLFLCALCASAVNSFSPAQLPPVNGMRPADPRCHALTNVSVITHPGAGAGAGATKIENATIVMRDGVIEAVGPKEAITIPADARIWPGDGLTVYPGLIEPALLIRADDARGAASHWNTRVHPETNMADQPVPDKSVRKDLRAMGFAVAAVYPSNGEFRGSGTVIALADDNEHVLTYRDKALLAATFDVGGFGGGIGRPSPTPGGTPAVEQSGYPSSLMGAIALFRQTILDAQWNAACRRIAQANPSLEPPLRNDAMIALDEAINRRQTILFDASDEANEIRATRVAREFNLDLVLLGCGTEFRRLDDVIALKTPLIIPLEFPKRPEVSTASQADSVSLRDLMTWEQAPTNPRRLLKAGATVSLTTAKLRNRSDYWANLRSAIKHGLTEDQALEAMTTTPAKLLGLDKQMGTIAPGMFANLVVVKGNLFDKDAKIRETWVNGRRFEISRDPLVQVKGAGPITFTAGAGATAVMPEGATIDIDSVKASVSLTHSDKKKISAKKVTVQQDQLSFVLEGRAFKVEGYVLFNGEMSVKSEPEKSSYSGTATLPDGSTFRFTAEITLKPKGAESKPEDGGEEASHEGDEGKKPDGAEGHEQKSEGLKDAVSGTWNVSFEEMREGMSVVLTLKLEGTNVSGTMSTMGRDREISGGKFDASSNKLTWTTETPDGSTSTTEATISGNSMTGTTTNPRFTRSFTATREGGGGGEKNGRGKKEEEVFVMPPEQLNYPFGDYGLTEPPNEIPAIILWDATIWTSGNQGVIPHGCMIIKEGKIDYVGPPTEIATTSGALVIDCKGKHITPGLIDCHSHTGVDGSVNEGAQTNSAECRIGDCIDPEDINWYHELAGGLTAVNQLHGSANPIGGQNSVVKIKWGATSPEGGDEPFRIMDAKPGIKFALGENVKRSTGRYPNSRMGVETFDRDAFTAAKDYRAKWDRYLNLPADKKSMTMPPQRDLELDALVEILEGKRIIHCHSYRQDEILALIRIADDFGFTIGTFQHVLEGYKVAEAIKEHGAGGSTFSDWWAYKIEVIDAIPFNGAIMHDVGVVVSFNSDSDELARRLNTEAAKAVRYGGVSPEEALKFVTLNPAKQLRIDHRTGSLEKGKDADFVIWSGDPLSSYSMCEQTWVDGACYYSIEKDKQLREMTQRERQRIIQKILTQAHGEPPKDKDKTPGSEAAASQSQPESQPEPKPREPGCCDEG